MIPRVAAPTSDGEGAASVIGTSAWDYVAFALQLLYWFRPFLLTAAAAHFSANSRKAPLGKTMTWSFWRATVAVEAAAIGASFAVKKYQPSIAQTGVTSAASSRAASPASPASQGSGIGLAEREVGFPRQHPIVDDAVLAARLRLLSRSLLRDPFFSLVLRDIIHRRVANGFVAKYVPLIGSIVSMMANYFLELQRLCFSFGVGDSPC
jgi:hypothetical protein